MHIKPNGILGPVKSQITDKNGKTHINIQVPFFGQKKDGNPGKRKKITAPKEAALQGFVQNQ